MLEYNFLQCECFSNKLLKAKMIKLNFSSLSNQFSPFPYLRIVGGNFHCSLLLLLLLF